MTDRGTRAHELGDEGEQAVKELLEERGYKVEPGEPGGYDLLVEGLVTVEVKTALLSGRIDHKGKRWQFCLYAHKGRQQPFEEDLLILRCESKPPCHFLIPALFIPEGLTKIDITHRNPWKYRGQWMLFREAWEVVPWVVTGCYFLGKVP